jgi:GntR family transcriptional regulator
LDVADFSRRPLYLQVKDALMGFIAEQSWKPDMALPNENELAREFGVSIGTVRKALDQMEADMIVTRIQGRGTFVLDPASSKVAIRFSNLCTLDGHRLSGDMREGRAEGSAASDAEALHLGIEPGAPVYRLHRVRGQGGKPFMREEAVLPQSTFPNLLEGGEVPLRLPILCQRYGLYVGRGEERVSLISADDDVASVLGVASGTPLLRLERVLYSTQGAPLEYRVGQTLMDELVYQATIG